MNTRERFVKTMRFETVDRPILWEFGYWTETMRKWYKEGLPGDPTPFLNINTTVAGEVQPWPMMACLKDRDVHEFFDLDAGLTRVPIQEWLYPPFEPRVLEETTNNKVIIDEWGIKQKVSKLGNRVPQFLEGPVKNREDFQRLKKERLDPDHPGRFPNNWDELAKSYQHRNYPLSVGGYPCGFFGSLRFLMGERIYYEFYDNPDLISEILDHLADMWIHLWEKVLKKVQVDMVLFWEDMSYNKGSLISPQMFRTFLTPRYKRVTKFLRDKGVDIGIVDTDGDCWELIPLFLEAGITGLYPFEVQSGMDIVEVRKKYPRLQIIGGLNKEAIAKSHQSIDEELIKVRRLIRESGFIACCDHNVPPNVTWDNFIYYRTQLNNILLNS